MTGSLLRHPGLPQSHGPAMSSEAEARRHSADPRALARVTNESEGNVQTGSNAGD